jgi:hypothetical protein
VDAVKFFIRSGQNPAYVIKAVIGGREFLQIASNSVRLSQLCSGSNDGREFLDYSEKFIFLLCIE